MLGMFDIPDLDKMGVDDTLDDDIDENDLESELESILSGNAGSKTKAQPKKKKVSSFLDIEKMAAECLNTDLSDENSDDESLTDPELLRELKGLSCESPEEEVEREEFNENKGTDAADPPAPIQKSSQSILPLLNERLKLYNTALSAANSVSDSSKVRRYGRGVKSLEKLIKLAESGKVVNDEDIPPPPPKPAGPLTAPTVPPKNITENLIDISCIKEEENVNDESLIATLKSRKQEYKVAALQAKKAGDKVSALECMKHLKMIDAALEKASKNELLDASVVPPCPPPYKVHPPESAKIEHGEAQMSSIEAAALSAASEPEDPKLFSAPPAPSSVLEALEQRLEKYVSTLGVAKAENNLSKARRLERIVKSYEKAIKDLKAGKSIDSQIEELPIPPGFAPIPAHLIESKSPLPAASKSETPLKKPDESVSPPQQKPARPAPALPDKSVKPKVQRTNTFDKQLDFLLERQRLFREAALSSKKSGHIDQAKEYLRMSKGFDSMIEAKKCGLPVDITSVPTPPQLDISESEFVIVDRFDCADVDSLSDFELFDMLQNDLTKQIEICRVNNDQYLKLGEVSSALMFEKLGLECKKDLSVIFHLRKAGHSPPKFHYETRIMSIVKCNTDLTDDQFEVTIEQGINLPGKPNDLDSYVKVEFPIPSNGPERAKTHTVRDTNNPVFDEKIIFTFNRKSRTQLRHFKRNMLKCEIFSKGGFLRNDTLLGTVTVKLVDLESKCSINDSFDLMDGRKPVGGKLQVKIRVRQPLLSKQVEQVREKWLVIES